MNLTGGANFPTDLIKRAKSIINQRIDSTCDTKRHIRDIAINNGWKT